jgi:microfibrillar-associated protein 1
LQFVPLNQAYRLSRRQSIFVQQRELEELQERIRRADAQIGNSTDEEDDDDESDDSESDNASKAPVRAAEPSRARATTYSARQPSIFAIRETKDEEEEQPKPRAVAPVAAAPIAQKHPRVDSHIEVSEEDENEEEEDDDDDDEDSEEDSSEEEAAPVRRRR